MKVAANVILIWNGNEASIPSGFTRESTLDGKYPKGAADGVNPNLTGGNATHTHTVSGTHSHSEVGTHTHSLTIGGLTSANDDRAGSDTLADHSHAGVTSNTQTGGGLTAVSCTYGAEDNDPPYQTVIFIKSSGTNKIPDGTIALYDNATLPTDWDVCDGTNSTPNLNGRYLKGRVGTGAATVGGSLTNTHDIVHTHGRSYHAHTPSTSGAVTGATGCDSWGGSTGGHLPYPSGYAHTHTITITNVQDIISATDPSVVTTETVEPAYTKLMPIQNNKGSEDLPKGVIGLWLGTLADIPRGWILCDGQNGTVDMRDRHLKLTTASGEIGDTGGSNTHTHTGDSHTHTSLGHTHTATTNGHTMQDTGSRGHNGGYTDLKYTDAADVHSVTVGSATPTYDSATTNAESSNNEPEYRTTAFIKFVGVTKGALVAALVA